jgi:hypothetical protein
MKYSELLKHLEMFTDEGIFILDNIAWAWRGD